MGFRIVVLNLWIGVFTILLRYGKASTHWIVTEDGKIQSQMDSVFSLKRPYDLMALMQQEQRAMLVEDLKEHLMTQKEEIDRREDKETNLEDKIYSTDEDCIIAGKPLTEFDLYFSTVILFDSKELRQAIVNDCMKEVSTREKYKKPNCTEIIELDFSMHAFEHLMGVKNRHNLSMSAEEGLLQTVSSGVDIEEFGNAVREAMKKNKTSWMLFNMAAYYWREKGDANNAIECLRRALHFSPREHKDIALISLGNVLHRAHFSEEAAVIVRAAIDIDPDNAISHYTLGNIYAVLADYNKSVVSFENALKVQPDFKNVEQHLHAVLCHSKLEKALEAQHSSLQRTLSELREYRKQHEFWLKQHEKLLSEQAPPEVKLEQRLEYEEQKIRESLDGRGQDCVQFQQNGHTVLSCNMRREAYYQGTQTQVDLSLNLQLIQAVESRAGRLGQKVADKMADQCHRS
ncbi:tetratricopeptide repeat protein 17-like [Limulus polyphemus]|uniref:Tetratricopeptide repeat protein 17-like n=1 Tax=Limulus polyphemus TaxID=6850 RepID=A0ABM1T2V4_LIMPO|nr:tetratricopeptide repeat protein 17-like [Limulus polyphemus]